MSLTKKVYLTISGYDIKLSDNLTFYQKDQLKLIFYINEYGIDYENNATARALMPVNPLNAILFIENPDGVDSVSSARIEDNAVTFYLDSTHTQYVGVSRMQLRLFDQDGCAITLPHFTFEIRENIYGSGDVRFQNVVMVDQTGTVILTEDNDLLDVGDILTMGTEVAYPQVAKTIKELPVKNNLDGTEKLIVEDDEATKQAPLGTIVDEIKQNSQEKIREIESDLAQTNAQLLNISNLSLVANSGYVFIEMNGNIIGNGVKINNGSTDTSQPIPDELHDEYRFIPDDMNTGILTKELETFTITSAGEKEKIGNLEFNIASSGYLNLDFNYNANNKAFVSNDSIIEIENIDFYDWCKINVDRFNIDTDKSVNYTVKFKNCKFSKVTGHKSNSVANILFENCEFREQVTLMNATYNKCYCGGEESIGRGFDGIYPYSNCHFKDCYFYFKCYKGGSGNHVDFVQYAGLENGIICENITVDNCRFEMPFLKLNGEVKDYPNACLMIQAERGSLNNIKITNCICNGGGYVFYLNEKGYSITNAVVDNIEIGASKRYGYLYPNRPDSYTWTNVRDTDILHVSSIYKSNNSTFITVTNDTNSDKELTIMTNKETFTKIIPKMPTYEQLSESDTFDDLPINLKIELGYDASWVVCKCDNVYLNAKKFF